MAKQIKTSITIQATPEKVWSVLTDFAGYPQWNPFIKSLQGDVVVGNTIEVNIQPPGSKPMGFKPKVLTYEPNRELSWLGKVLFTGLFDGLHKFKIEDHGDGSCTFFHEENFSGILVPLINLSTTEDGFISMNNSIKARAEAM